MQSINDYKKGDYKKEIWRDVVGYEGIYMVSNLGRVKSLLISCVCKNCGAIIKDKNIKKLTQNHDNYQVAHLTKNGQTKSFKVHRLVAMAFLPNNYSPDKQVDHLDGNRSNNNSKNLKWCTHIENYKNRDKRRFDKRIDKDELVLLVFNHFKWNGKNKTIPLSYVRKKLNIYGIEYLIKKIKSLGYSIKIGKHIINVTDK